MVTHDPLLQVFGDVVNRCARQQTLLMALGDRRLVRASIIGADPVGREQRLILQHLAEEALGGLQIAVGGEQQDAQMRADRELAESIATLVQVKITIQGWLDDGGKPWILRFGENVTVYSPMLFPDDRMQLAIQSMTHRQGSATGTLTDLERVCATRAWTSMNDLFKDVAITQRRQVDSSIKRGLV